MKGSFSIKKRIYSFKYAFKGLLYAFKTQPNLWIHGFAVIIVIWLGFYFKISKTEWITILLTIGLVIVAELINTALEMIVDYICPHFNEKAGIIKDIAAGAVLFAALIALISGLIIFLPKLMTDLV